MNEPDQGYIFNPADLVEYAMDKPIGAARAALAVALEKADVHVDIVIEELSENMELNQGFLQELSGALRKNPSKVLGGMPNRIKGRQFERDIGL